MNAFQKIPQCEKCGNIEFIKVEYIPGAGNEHLAYDCLKCKYKWQTQVKKQTKQEPQTIVEANGK